MSLSMLAASCNGVSNIPGASVVRQSHLLQKINQLQQRLIGAVLDLVPLESAEVLIYGLCTACQNDPATDPGQRDARNGNILSLTTFMRSICASSPSRMFRNASPTLVTTPWHEASSLASSSACWTSASSVPILNSGMGKEDVDPFSGETVVDTASRASSRWCEGTMEEGRERRRYLLGLDILATASRAENPDVGEKQEPSRRAGMGGWNSWSFG